MPANNRWRRCSTSSSAACSKSCNSPSKISAADLEQIRRRIDAASLLFKVRVMSDELRQREQRAGPFDPANVNHANNQLTIMTRTDVLSMFVAALALPARAARPRARRPSAMPAIPRSPCSPARPGCRRRRCRCAIGRRRRESRRRRADDLRPGRDAIEEGKFDRAVDRSRSADRAEEQPHRRGALLEGLQPVQARTARRGAHHARRSAEAVRRQPLDQGRQGARGRSAAGLRPDGLAGVAGRRGAEADGAARHHAERSRAGAADHREDADRHQLAEGQGPRAVRPQPEPLGARPARSSPASPRATPTRTCSCARSATSASWAAPTTARSWPTSTRARTIRR